MEPPPSLRSEYARGLPVDTSLTLTALAMATRSSGRLAESRAARARIYVIPSAKRSAFAPARSTSASRTRWSGAIHKLAGPVDGSPQVRVMDSAGFDKIDGAFQSTTQGFGKIKKLVERR